MRKKSKGRRKIEIKKLEDEDKLHVAFSKRRNGLIKLANEFSILTGAEISILVFSPGDRVYPFGTPDANTIIQRYENQNQEPFSAANNIDMLVQASSAVKQEELNSELCLLEKEVITLKRRGKLLDLLIGKSKLINDMDKDKDNDNDNDNDKNDDYFKDLDLNKLEDLLECAKDLRTDFEVEIAKKTVDFSQRKFYGLMKEGVPSIFDLFLASSCSDKVDFTSTSAAYCGLMEPANYGSSWDVGTAGVVQFAGPSRINNGGGTGTDTGGSATFEMNPGASSFNPSA